MFININLAVQDFQEQLVTICNTCGKKLLVRCSLDHVLGVLLTPVKLPSLHVPHSEFQIKQIMVQVYLLNEKTHLTISVLQP